MLKYNEEVNSKPDEINFFFWILLRAFKLLDAVCIITAQVQTSVDFYFFSL